MCNLNGVHWTRFERDMSAQSLASMGKKVKLHGVFDRRPSKGVFLEIYMRRSYVAVNKKLDPLDRKSVGVKVWPFGHFDLPLDVNRRVAIYGDSRSL